MKTATAKTPNNVIEFEDSKKKATNILERMTKQSTTKAKSKLPLISDESITEVVDTALELKKEIADIETRLDVQESLLRNRVFTEYARDKGKTSSYKLQGTGPNTLTCSFKNKFSHVPLDTKESLVNTLGEKFPQYFTEVYEISVKDTSVGKIQELIDLVGEEKFMECFEVKKSYLKVCADMNSRQFELPKEVRNFIKQDNASIKI